MKKRLLIIGIVLIIVIGSFLAIKIITNNNSKPPTLTANFIDIEKVERISKFRSCQGHIVIPTDESETKRNMKHYVIIKPEFRGKDTVKLYAPYDGWISGFFSNTNDGLEGEIWLSNGNEWEFSFEHIHVLPSINVGTRVKAGDLLGYVPDKGFDVVYAVGASSQKVIDGWNSPFVKLDSAFLHMDAATFSQYQNLGVSNPETFIYTKDFRDNNPCEYRDKQGGLNDFAHPEDWITFK